MAILSPSTVSVGGAVVTYVAASGGGDQVKCGARTFISVRNGGGGSITVTVNDTKSRAPQGSTAFNPDLSVVVGPGVEKDIGPLPTERFANNVGNAEISYSGVTDVTVAARR